MSDALPPAPADLVARIVSMETRWLDLEERVMGLQSAVADAINHHAACGLTVHRLEEMLRRVERVGDRLSLAVAELGGDD